jgi:predicted transcriptional regulator
MSIRKGPRTLTARQVILFFFDLKDSELEIYSDLLKNGPATTKDLGERMKKDRSPIYKVVTKLHSCGLVNKVSRKQGGGAIYYIYEAVDPQDVQDQLLERLDSWINATQGAARRAGSELRKGS